MFSLTPPEAVDNLGVNLFSKFFGIILGVGLLSCLRLKGEENSSFPMPNRCFVGVAGSRNPVRYTCVNGNGAAVSADKGAAAIKPLPHPPACAPPPISRALMMSPEGTQNGDKEAISCQALSRCNHH